MENNSSSQSQSVLPPARFQFIVTIGNKQFAFQEITGLSNESEDLEYRKGNTRGFSPIKMTGLQKSGNITLKRGVFTGDKALWDDFRKNAVNERQTVTISLLDETNAAVMNWTLSNAFPIKAVSADLKAEGNEVAVETLELGHEGISINS